MIPLQANLGPVASLFESVGIPAAYATPLGQITRFLIGFMIVYAVSKVFILPLIKKGLTKRDLDEHAQTPLLLVSRIGLIVVAFSVAFGFGGFGNFLVAMTGIAAAGAFALAFAMQNVIANFVSGVFIYTDKPFRIGDWIEWDGNTGIVEDISLRVTRVRTFDNELLTVPNSQLTDNVVKNPVDGDRLRQKFVFGIGYGDDIETATEIMIEEAEDHPDVMADPKPSVRLIELNDSDIGLQSRIWIANPSRSDFMRVRGEYIKSVKERFDAAGIDIPYPIRTLDGAINVGNPAALETADD